MPVEEKRSESGWSTDDKSGAAPSFDAELPSRLGPYRVIGLLGQGGMGMVYRAVHEPTGRPAALKTVRVPYGSALASLRCEIHALSRVSHPGIVRIFDEGVADGLPWYAMELLTGRTLDDFIAELWSAPPKAIAPEDARKRTEVEGPPVGRSWDEPTKPMARGVLATGNTRPRAAAGRLKEALSFVRRLCSPLAFMHGAGIVHRDLKPSNVFLRDDGATMLVDFGLVSRAEGVVGREVIEVLGHVRGTAAYISPEQINGDFVDARCDLYALGCMLYELLTGQVPFFGATAREIMSLHLYGKPVPPSMKVDGVPPELDALVLRLLAKERRNRLGHADDVAAVLAELGADDFQWPQPPPAARDYLYRPELSGRRDVLADLQRRLRATRDGEGGGLVLLGGESGVGKTYLATAAARRATLDRMRVVTGECIPVATPDSSALDVKAPPLHPFHQLFETVADLCREHGVSMTDRLLGRWGKVLAVYEPSLRRLPGQDRHPEPPEVPAQAASERLLIALREVVGALAAEAPLCLVLDDLQWADELSLSFLSSVSGTVGAEWFTRHPVLILGTYRSEERNVGLDELLAEPDVHRIDLPRLDEATLGAIIGDMLALSEAPRALVHALSQRSDGNPFFVAEYLRTAVAERLLFRDNGAWRTGDLGAANPFDSLPLPRSLGELVGRRLDGLSAESRALVEVAAVLGREVDGDLLVAVAGLHDESEALELIKDLLARQVLEEVRAGRFRFVHDKLRETAWERIPDGRRRDLHGRAGREIESRARAKSTTGERMLPLSELAHHFSEAGELERAMEYLDRAASQAESTFANREAASFLTDALALDARLEARPDPRADAKTAPLMRAAWERRLAHALLGQGRLVESQQHLHRAVSLLGFPFPRTTLHVVLGLAWQVARQVVHRIRRPRWRQLPAPRREHILEAARAYEQLMPVTYFVTGNLPRILYATLGNLNLAERAGPSPVLALAYANALVTVGMVPWPRFQIDLAEAYAHMMFRGLQGVSDPAVESWAYILAGSYAVGVGDYERAISLGRRAEAIGDSVGFGRRVEEAMGVIATAQHLTGDFTGGVKSCDKLQSSASRGDPQTQVWGFIGEAQHRVMLGEVEPALAAGHRAEACLSQKLFRPERIFVWGVLSYVYLRANQLDKARETVERALAEMEAGRATSFYCITAYTFVADTVLELWAAAPDGPEREALAKLRARALRQLLQSAKVFPVHRAKAALLAGRADFARGRVARARRRFEQGIQIAQKLRLAYDEALLDTEIARMLAPSDPERRQRLWRALAVFTERRATWDVARAQALLGD